MKKISYYLLKHRQLAILSLLLLLAEVREGVQLSFVTLLISMSKKKSYCAINDDLRLKKYFQQKSQSIQIENEILPVFHRDGDFSPTVASTTRLSRKIITIFLRIPEYFGFKISPSYFMTKKRLPEGILSSRTVSGCLSGGLPLGARGHSAAKKLFLCRRQLT